MHGHEVEIATAGRPDRHTGCRRCEAERVKALVPPRHRDALDETREQGHGHSDDGTARRQCVKCDSGDEAAGGSAGQAKRR